MSFSILDPKLINHIHDKVIMVSGGLPGLAKDKSLEGALNRIDTHINYDGINDLFEIAALYTKVIAQGHVFNDGNKRTAFICTYIFLGLNHYLLTISYENAVETMVNIAEKKLNLKEIAEWLKINSRKNKGP